MRMTRLVSIFALSAALALSGIASSALAQNHDDSHDLEEMLARVNEMRAAAGLGPLMRDDHLDRAARAHSEDMADHDMLSHVSPRSGDPAARVAAQNLAVTQLSENISLNTDVLVAHDAFVASEGHRTNLLNPAFNRIGLGAARAARGVYVTQVFATVTDGRTVAPPAPAQVAVAGAQTPAPSAVQAPALSGSAQLQASAPQQEVRVPQTGTRHVTGYWVQSGGRWWYYPLPADARPGQLLTPSSSQPTMSQPSVTVQPAPYYYVAPSQSTYVYRTPQYQQPVYQQPVYQQPYYQQPVYVQQPYYQQRVYVQQPVAPVYVQPMPVGPSPAFGWSPRRHYNSWSWR